MFDSFLRERTGEENNLLKTLCDKKIITPEKAEHIWKKYQNKNQQTLNILEGILIQLDYTTGSLHLKHYPNQKSITDIQLIAPLQNIAHPDPRDLVLIDKNKGDYVATYKLKKDTGLLITPKGSFIYAEGFETKPHLSAATSFIDTPLLKEKQRQHFDLYYSHHQNLAVVFHRETGTLHLISLETYQSIGEIELTDPTEKAINICFSPKESILYITDNKTPTLYILEHINQEFHLKKWQSGLGVLGNFWLTPDGRHAFLSTLTPKLQLIYFDFKDLKGKYSLDTKGESCCHKGFLPQDLLLATPDQKHLAYMTYLPEKNNLPVIHIIRTDKIRTVRRYSVKEQAQPDLLACALRHPYQDLVQLDLQTLLIAEKQVDADRLETIQTESLEQKSLEKQELSPLKRTKIHQDSVRSAPEVAIDIWKLIDKDASRVPLPPSAEHIIVELFIWRFYETTLTNLRVHKTEVFRLEKMAKKIKEQLENKEAVLFKVPALLGQYNFETPISRDEVLKLLDSPSNLIKGPLFELERCPACQSPQPADTSQKQCLDCLYQWDTPQAKEWRKKTSFQAAFGLPVGQILIYSKKNLLILNAWRKILTVLEGKPPWFKELTSVVALPNGHLLITDGPNKKVGEYTPQGKMVRRIRGRFEAPSYATAYPQETHFHYLIIDGTSVLELDDKSKEIRRFPPKMADNPLLNPHMIQRTPNNHWLITDQDKVISVSPEGQITQSFSEGEGIHSPLFAHQISSGNLVIVDKKDYQVHLFGETKSFSYWPLPEHSHLKTPPISAHLLHNEDLLFVGPDYIFSLNIETASLRWVSSLPETKNHHNVFQLQQLKGDRSLEQQEKVEEYAKALSAFEMFGGQSEKRLASLAEYLTPIEIEPNDILLNEITRSNAVFFILDGALDLIEQTHQQEVATLKKGDVLGAVALMYSENELKVKVVVKAKEKTKVLQLKRTDLKKVLVRLPIIFQALRKLGLYRRKQIRLHQDKETQKVTDELALKIVKSKMKRHPLFQGASDPFLEALAPCLNAVAYMPDQTIFSRGESGGTMFFINDGEVGLLRKGEHIPEVLLASGNIFGEMSLISDARRNATMLTMDYCRFYTLEQEDFIPLIQSHPWFEQKLLEVAEQRRKENEESQSEFAFKMGILRNDLPQTECWSPLDLREDKLTYFASALMNMTMGVENNGDILWCLGQEPDCDLFQPYRMHLEQDFLFVADTGNERIIQLALNPRSTVKEWVPQGTSLSQPRSGVITPHQQLLIADTGNSRLLMIDEEGEVLWTFEAPHEIMSPFYAEMTVDNHILFVDQELHMVYEVDLEGEVLWSFGKVLISGDGQGELNAPGFAQKLNNNDILIADTGNDRILLVGSNGIEKAIYYGTPEFPLNRPKHCVVRENGDILVFLEEDETIIRLDHWGEPIWGIQFTPAQAIQEAKTKEVPWVLDESILEDLEEDSKNEPSEQSEEELMPWGLEVDSELWDDELEDDFERGQTLVLNLKETQHRLKKKKEEAPFKTELPWQMDFDEDEDGDYLTSTVVLNKTTQGEKHLTQTQKLDLNTTQMVEDWGIGEGDEEV